MYIKRVTIEATAAEATNNINRIPINIINSCVTMSHKIGYVKLKYTPETECLFCNIFIDKYLRLMNICLVNNLVITL